MLFNKYLLVSLFACGLTCPMAAIEIPFTCPFSTTANITKAGLSRMQFLSVIISVKLFFDEYLFNSNDVQADPIVVSFIREQLAKTGIEHSEDIRIVVKNYYASGSYATGFKSIFINEHWHKELVDLLNQRKKIQEGEHSENEALLDRTLNIHTFLIHHEANHLKNYDTFYSVLVTLAAAIATEIGHQKLINYLHSEQETAQSGWLRSFLEGYLKWGIVTSIKCAYARYFEQRADDQVMDDPALLEAGKQYFYWLHEQVRKKLTLNPEGQTFFDKHPQLYGMFDLLHPTNIARAQKLEERIACLQEAN